VLGAGGPRRQRFGIGLQPDDEPAVLDLGAVAGVEDRARRRGDDGRRRHGQARAQRGRFSGAHRLLAAGRQQLASGVPGCLLDQRIVVDERPAGVLRQGDPDRRLAAAHHAE
jgi:hypothetical protein